ncbi:MAG: porin family protein [Bacteroidota bacterium]
MRKQISIFATIFLLLIFVSTINGQTEKKLSKPSFGILAGGTLSNISNYDGNNRLGFLIGVYVERNFTKKLSLLTNISYAQRGALGNDSLSSIKLGYITLPLMIQYNITDKLGVFTGIAWDGLISVNGDDLDRDDFRDSDWRVPIGLGYNITQNLKLGIAYNFGLTDITKNDDEILRNNWGSIALVYVFKKKKD